MKELIFYPTTFGLTGHSFRTRTISHFCPKAEAKAAKPLNNPNTPKNTIYNDEEDAVPSSPKRKKHHVTEKPKSAYF